MKRKKSDGVLMIQHIPNTYDGEDMLFTSVEYWECQMPVQMLAQNPPPSASTEATEKAPTGILC